MLTHLQGAICSSVNHILHLAVYTSLCTLISETYPTLVAAPRLFGSATIYNVGDYLESNPSFQVLELQEEPCAIFLYGKCSMLSLCIEEVV